MTHVGTGQAEVKMIASKRRVVLEDGRVTFGRDHHPYSFSLALVGGGLKGGQVYGATDEIGWHATGNPVHINDLHATMLHQFGLDHRNLAHRFQGRDYRLPDVDGRVIRGWTA